MNVCQDHWDRLRVMIEERGLSHLIATDGATAVAQLADQLRAAEDEEREEVTPANFDPLMSAFWAIGSNVMQFIANAGGNPLYLMTEGPEDPVEGYEGAEGRTWPKCGLCYLGLAHELTCGDPRCELPRVDGYAWMLGRAADESLERARKLGLVE